MSTAHQEGVTKNKTFFTNNEGYAENVATLGTYRNIRKVVDREVQGLPTLLDVGNGGVFDYNTSLVGHIVAVDLFLDDSFRETFPPNAEPRKGDALALNEEPDSFDGALLAFLFHHLVGSSHAELLTNVRRAISESRRALKPGGKLIVVESCVPSWFHALERILYAPLKLLASTPAMKHPPTLQLPYKQVNELLSEQLTVERAGRIDVGPWILQFGHRWPTALTPARPYFFVCTKA